MRDVLEFWIQLHSRPEIEISFKFIPKILMSKECIHFLGHSVLLFDEPTTQTETKSYIRLYLIHVLAIVSIFRDI